MPVIGLIAGNGQFPLVVARGARSRGLRVIAVAVREEADPALSEYVDECHWISVGQLGGLLAAFAKAGVTEAIMAGQVRPERALGAEGRVDPAMAQLLARVPTKTTDALLGAIAGELARHGVRLIDSTSLVADALPSAGVLTASAPTAAQQEDIRFGVRIARGIGGFDIGQTVVVKERAVLAVEAMEGTDETIRRAGRLSAGAVVVKLAKPSQDMRFDVPVIGVKTIAVMAEARASCLAIEAGKTLMLDREAIVAQADRSGIVILALGQEFLG